MTKDENLKWIDKDALVIIIIILALILVGLLSFLIYSLVKNDVESVKIAIVMLGVVILFILAWGLTGAHSFPLKI